MKKEIPKYCRACGQLLIWSKERADKIEIEHYNFGGTTVSRLASAFNQQTGEENIADIYTCPLWKKTWLRYSPHDKIVHYNNELYYQ